MKAYLSERGIEFEDRDVTADPQAVEDLIHKYKSRMTPTMVIGDEIIVGFAPDRIDELLAQ